MNGGKMATKSRKSTVKVEGYTIAARFVPPVKVKGYERAAPKAKKGKKK